MNSVVGFATFVTVLQLGNKGPKAVHVALFNYTRQFVSGILVASCCPASSSLLLLLPPHPL